MEPHSTGVSKMGGMKRRCWALSIACTCAALVALRASAVDFTVTRTDDPVPDGCAPDDCSLREAVIAANALAGADRVLLGPHTYTLSLAGAGEDAAATGDLDLLDDVTIEGLGSAATTIAVTGGIDRAIDAGAATGRAIAIEGVTVSGGAAGNAAGGGLSIDTGDASGSVTLDDVVLASNSATDGGGASIRSPHVRLRNVDVHDNLAAASAGGLRVTVLAGPPDRFASIHSLTVEHNTAASIGGFDLQTDELGTEPVTALVEQNTATGGSCGGMRFGAGTSTAQMKVALQLTIWGNLEQPASAPAPYDGGGGLCVENCGTPAPGAFAVSIVDSTFQTNYAYGNGGSIITRAVNSCGDAGILPVDLSVRRSTLWDQTSSYGGGIMHTRGLAATTGRLEIVDSDVASYAYGSGGGVWTEGNLRVEGSRIYGQAVSSAGALLFEDPTGAEHVSIERSTIEGGAGGVQGGGISVPDGGTLDITASTVDGGGVENGGSLYARSATVSIDRSTFADGNARSLGGLIYADGSHVDITRSTLLEYPLVPVGALATAIYATDPGSAAGPVNISDSIVYGSCGGDALPVSASHVIEGPGDTCGFLAGPDAATNLANVSIEALALTTLGDHGGPTHTYLPLAGSVAVTHPIDGACDGVPDQRGYLSVAPCDVGAVDSDAPEPGAAIGALAAIAALLRRATARRGGSRSDAC
jgi:CSLREA domain-containing protein